MCLSYQILIYLSIVFLGQIYQWLRLFTLYSKSELFTFFLFIRSNNTESQAQTTSLQRKAPSKGPNQQSELLTLEESNPQRLN